MAAVERGTPHPSLANYCERFRARERRLTAQLSTMFEGELASSGEMGTGRCDAIDKGTKDIAAALALDASASRTSSSSMRRRCAGYPLARPGMAILPLACRAVSRRRCAASQIAINCCTCCCAMEIAAEGVDVAAE
ncbi:MAG: hypothetical protein QM765_25790 [Myxococcales bacterium]